MVGDELVEAELSQYHDISWPAVCAGQHAPRHILALLRNMPAESRTAQILRGYVEMSQPRPTKRPKPKPLYKYLGWGPVETRLAQVVQQLQLSRHEYAQSLTDKRLKEPDLIEIPTPPDQDKAEKRRASLYELARQNHMRLKEGA